MLAKSILIGALAAVAAAQGQVSKVLFFTKVPNPVTAGQPQAITYSTNETSTPATIILRKGVQSALQTVQTLTTDATNGQYVWTPAKSLANGVDYALEIKQGTQFNYFGPFTLQGGSIAGVSSSSGSSSASGSSSSMTATTGTTNTTKTGVSPPYATGNMTHHNTTMTHATKTTTVTASSSSTSSAMTPTGPGFQTTTAPSPTSTGAAATIATGGSAVAVLIGAVAAMLFC